MQPDPRRRVAVFLHAGEPDRLHQGCAIAAAATAMGRHAQVFFFWWALDRLVRGELDAPVFPDAERDPAQAAAQDAFERGVPTAGALLSAARESGLCTVYACSASAELVGRRPDEVTARVDLVVGWSSILALTEGVVDRFYL